MKIAGTWTSVSLCVVVLASTTALTESRNLQAALCRCEIKKDKLDDDDFSSTGPIIGGVRVLPKSDDACSGRRLFDAEELYEFDDTARLHRGARMIMDDDEELPETTDDRRLKMSSSSSGKGKGKGKGGSSSSSKGGKRSSSSSGKSFLLIRNYFFQFQAWYSIKNQ